MNKDSAHSTNDSKRLHTLYSVSSLFNQVTTGLDPSTILPEALRLVMRSFDAPEGSLFIIDDNHALVHTWLIEDDHLVAGSQSFFRQVMVDGVAGLVVQSGQPIIVHDTINDPRWLSKQGHPTAVSICSAISVPLSTQSGVHGVVTLSKPQAHQFDQDDLNLLTAVANQIAYTIANFQLYQASQRYAQELAVLVAATVAVSATLDTQKVFELIAEQMTLLIHVESCAIIAWDEEHQTMQGHAWHTATAQHRLDTSRLVDLNQTELVQDLLDMPRPVQLHVAQGEIDPHMKQWMARGQMQALLILPLIAQSQVIGFVLLMDAERPHLFSDAEISLGQTLASQAAVAVQNARLYSETQRQLRITQLLNQAGRVINSSLDLNQIMQSLLSQMNEFLRAEAVSIALLDLQANELVFSVADGMGSEHIVGMRIPPSQGVAGWVLQNNEPARVNDVTQDERFHQQGDQRTGHTTRAIICAPLTVKGRALGTIQAINPTARRYFTENELGLLVSLANFASSAVANAQQYEETQAAESRYMGLFQDSIDPMILTDRLGRIIEVNGRASELLEYDRDELLRLRIINLHPVETGLLGERSFQPIQTRQIKMFASEIITKNRRRTPVEVYAKRLYMGDTQILQWIYHDITEQVELEQMRQDLMAMLFHDMQSPIANVISSLELLTEELPQDGSQMVVDMLDVATKSSGRLQRLVKSLLDISRLEAGHPIRSQQSTSVTRLVEDALETVQAALERRHITLRYTPPSAAPKVYVDPDMIRRVLSNLMDNALKYSQDGQTIAIDVLKPDDQEMILLAVTDQGPGIPRMYREIIFEKFRRVQEHAARQGTGLGLAFCRLAVEAHGGRIWADSGAEGGARFNFTLPLAPPPAPN